jgi:hypothetical protein
VVALSRESRGARVLDIRSLEADKRDETMKKSVKLPQIAQQFVHATGHQLEVARIGRHLNIGNPIYDLILNRGDTFIEPSLTITIPPARAHRFEPVLRLAVHHLDQLGWILQIDTYTGL